ncbi:WD40 repeat-like protein [Conidiobolus coronatus NRRL 28638]|uniref:WD40 repeat-like protein n=1 Tax=Conidiobolus coronatus (strain ATCC 28846 / CBS 209.66 / NRRL 28638) TaxID=796925 RepID=A0A137PBV4_CONC2|nr:WD40 repeat-like protein [Conidiobolus coronatus NRRL 28638]|eukprot:KXN72421.1 WD40 repeat-like protein [Conidiobolus coronatus NRRL 28638]
MAQLNQIELANPPSDSINNIQHSPNGNYLLASSWDNKVYIYQLGQNLSANSLTSFDLNSPVLVSKWDPTSSKIFSGTGEGKGILYDCNSQQSVQVASHEKGIKGVAWINENMVATGSWDKTLKYWDIRSPPGSGPTAQVELAERCYSMDYRNDHLIIAMAQRAVALIKTNNPTTIVKSERVQLKFQSRCIKLLPSLLGYAISSVESRTAVHYFVDDYDCEPPKLSFAFSCHKLNDVLYPVHDLAFHPQTNCLTTAGGEGTVRTWDLSTQNPISVIASFNNPIVSIDYHPSGQSLAIATSNDFLDATVETHHKYKTSIYLAELNSQSVTPATM